MKIEVTFRDLYYRGDETVELVGDVARKYERAVNKTDFLKNLETVYFDHPYVVRTKKTA